MREVISELDYGLVMSMSITASMFLAIKIAKNEGKNPDIIWQLTPWILTAGVLAARLYHVLDFWWYYGTYPELIFSLRQGGLGIYGAIFGGFLSMIIYLKLRKESVLEWLDIAGLVLPLGQFFGRWGNVLNNELLPYAYYESIANLALFLILQFIYRKYSRFAPGTLFFLYIAGYGVIRFVLEFMRSDSWVVYGLNIAQSISIIAVGISVFAAKVVNVRKNH